MNLIAKNLNYLIEKHRTNPNALAEATKTKQPTIHRILSGESNDPRTSTLAPIATYFNVSVEDLRSKNLETGIDVNIEAAPNLKGRIPVISFVEAGDWCLNPSTIELGETPEYVSTTKSHGPRTFGVMVRGSSFPKNCRFLMQ